MLAVKAPIWKIAEVLELGEATIWRHYKHIIDLYDVQPGPRPHQANADSRNRVKLMAIAGIGQDDIARVMGFCVETLVAHYREELDLALIEANTKVAGNMLMMATGPRDQKTTVTAAIWWTKARMGWKDTSRVENTGADGGPMQVENQVVVVLPDNGRGGVIEGVAEAVDQVSLPEAESTDEED